MVKTLQERYVAALTAKGHREVKRTHKFIVFSCDEFTFYYLGKAGSLRFGPTVANSMACGDQFKYKLLHEAEIGAI